MIARTITKQLSRCATLCHIYKRFWPQLTIVFTTILLRLISFQQIFFISSIRKNIVESAVTPKVSSSLLWYSISHAKLFQFLWLFFKMSIFPSEKKYLDISLTLKRFFSFPDLWQPCRVSFEAKILDILKIPKAVPLHNFMKEDLNQNRLSPYWFTVLSVTTKIALDLYVFSRILLIY